MVVNNKSFLLGLLLLVSCSIDEEKPATPDVPVRFSSDLSEQAESRAANDSWEAGDQVGIYMIPHVADASAAADLSSAYTHGANVPYVTSGSGTSVSLSVVSGSHAIVYPVDGSDVNFVAYYPYRSANSNTYNVDVSNQSPAKAIDLLYHKGTGTAYNRDDTDVALAFTHRLSKMEISLIPASGAEVNLTDATLTLTGFPATADFNLSTGALTNLGGTDQSLTPVKDESASSGSRAVFEAVIVPHGMEDSYTRIVTFTIGGTAYRCTLSTSNVFEAGVVHRYTFRFTGHKIVMAQKNIVDWEGGTVAWGDNLLTAGKLSFDLGDYGTSGHTVTLSTNAQSAPEWTLSNEADTQSTDEPGWITDVSLSDPTDDNGLTRYTLTFATDHNIGVHPRTGYIRLEIAGLMLAIRVTQAGAAMIDMHDGLTNCYMVVPGSSVSIPITRAITIGGLGTSTDATAEILWDDNNVISGNPTLSGTGATRTFTVRASSGRQGNAVIALKSGNTIYWSWHIWVTAYNPNTGATWTNNGYTFMDRNLGATEAALSLAGRGLFYQWGRKDPFPGGKEGTAGYAALDKFFGIDQAGAGGTASVTVSNENTKAAGIVESIRKPTTFFRYCNYTYYDWLPANVNTLWNTSLNSKSVYDPCPTGWRVPYFENNSPWYGLAGQRFKTDDGGGVDWSNPSGSGNGLFPASGCRGGSVGEFYIGGYYGLYWSASVPSTDACSLSFDYDGTVFPSVSNSRASGLSVRCVKE
jgi:hypothetical protein